MGFSWNNCPSQVKEFVLILHKETAQILQNNIIGFYLHGSLAMGGFNPNSSDIDLLAVTKDTLKAETKRKIAQILLSYSNSPFPIEISFIQSKQLENWRHPCQFDFHFSEMWRKRYEKDLIMGTNKYLNEKMNTDPDLAAHITIMNSSGICIEGAPIADVFPIIPRADYISSIMGDFQDCLINIEKDPIYCILNLIRVYRYLKEGVISSKQEAGQWGMSALPKEMQMTIKKAADLYEGKKKGYQFHREELLTVKNFFSVGVQESKTHG